MLPTGLKHQYPVKYHLYLDTTDMNYYKQIFMPSASRRYRRKYIIPKNEKRWIGKGLGWEKGGMKSGMGNEWSGEMLRNEKRTPIGQNLGCGPDIDDSFKQKSHAS